MPRFKILPVDPSFSATEINAVDGGSVLSVVTQLNCKEADVLQDDLYTFSVRIDRNGLWSIFQRDPDAGPHDIQPFG